MARRASAGRGPAGGVAGRGAYGVIGHDGRRQVICGRRPGRRRRSDREETPSAAESNIGRRSRGPRGTAVAGGSAWGVIGTGHMDSIPTAAITTAGCMGTGTDTTAPPGVGAAAGVAVGMGLGWGFGTGLDGLGLGWGLPCGGMARPCMAWATCRIRTSTMDPASWPRRPYDYSVPIDTMGAPADETTADPAMTLFDAGRASFSRRLCRRARSRPIRLWPSCRTTRRCTNFAGSASSPWRGMTRPRPRSTRCFGRARLGLDDSDQPVPECGRVYRKAVLEEFCKANPAVGHRHDLCSAYQYLSEGFTDAAVTMLKQVVALKPNDTLSAKLLSSSMHPSCRAGAQQAGGGAG